jgi:FMN phosphatase YigB (HAD superfamily)
MTDYSWLKEIKAIGWDLDGTLYPPGSIPSEAIRHEMMRRVADSFGWDIVKATAEFERVYRQFNSHTKTLTALGVNGEDFFTRLWDELRLENYLQSDTRIVSLITAVRDLGLRQFIVTNSNREDQIQRKLRLIGLDPEFFEVRVSTVGLGAVKPEPKPFWEAVGRLNRRLGSVESVEGVSEIKPEQILYIGDREKTDIVGAKQVGMRTCLAWGASEVADISVPTVYDIQEILTEAYHV